VNLSKFRFVFNLLTWAAFVSMLCIIEMYLNEMCLFVSC